MNDYSKYQVPKYQTVYVASLYSKNKDEFFDSLELALEYMRDNGSQDYKESFKEETFASGNCIYFTLVNSGHGIGRIDVKIIPHV